VRTARLADDLSKAKQSKARLQNVTAVGTAASKIPGLSVGLSVVALLNVAAMRRTVD